MAKYTKVIETRQYTEVVYYKDGEEIERETRFDDHAYDATGHETVTQDEIEDWGWE